MEERHREDSKRSSVRVPRKKEEDEVALAGTVLFHFSSK